MSWFKRIKEGITTSTREKRETPEGLWYKCGGCKKIIATQEHADNLWVCPRCGFHERIGSEEYFQFLFDEGKYTEINANLASADPLQFVDTKKYSERIKETQEKTGLKDAVRTAYGKLNGHKLMIAAMDFKFIGGSMGSVMGEKIAQAILFCIDKKMPLLIISRSGGARMMEAALSLMQMAKTAALLTRLSDARIPYISLLTDPTTGGVTASFAMLGDLNIAEPGALIGFAGPRVIKETIGRDLPKGFQTAEFLLEKGFIDLIIDRRQLKEQLTRILDFFKN